MSLTICKDEEYGDFLMDEDALESQGTILNRTLLWSMPGRKILIEKNFAIESEYYTRKCILNHTWNLHTMLDVYSLILRFKRIKASK